MATRLWKRPKDLTRIIDHLTTDPSRQSAIADRHIAAIGHSLGGYTVMAATGARFDTTRYDRYCHAHPERADCRWYRSVAVTRNGMAIEKLEDDLTDARLRAVVPLDLGLTQAFDPKSVAKIEIPVLVIGTGQHQPDLPVDVESRHLATMWPKSTTTYREIAGISHFSFFPICRPGARDLLAARGEGDEIICADGGGRDRDALHVEIEDMIKTFLLEAGCKMTLRCPCPWHLLRPLALAMRRIISTKLLASAQGQGHEIARKLPKQALRANGVTTSFD